MNECYGKSFIKNGDLISSVFFDNSLVYEGDSIYEVIRITDGNPVFFHDHMARLEQSIRLQSRDVIAGIDTLRRDLVTLSGSETKKEVNLKIVFNYNSGSCNYLIYFIEPIYPSQDQYNNGVKGILLNAERKDPSSKVINHKLRSDIYHKLILGGAYEALLVNHKNCITEGSRSNIFFIRREILYTAPEKVVLSGITRRYILEICREQSIRVIFECVRTETIGDYDSVFMSGTSPMVLPFSCIDNTFFDVKLPLMTELRNLYLDKAKESIRQFKSD